MLCVFFFFKQKTAYEMRISDWSSDVCSSDLPDGRRLALTLSRSGNPEIYLMDLGSKALTQITNQFGIDTEPAWSADGSSLYFTPDRGGQPPLYQVSASEGSAPRATFQGRYTPRPQESYDYHKIAVAPGHANGYRMAFRVLSLRAPRV